MGEIPSGCGEEKTNSPNIRREVVDLVRDMREGKIDFSLKNFTEDEGFKNAEAGEDKDSSEIHNFSKVTDTTKKKSIKKALVTGGIAASLLVGVNLANINNDVQAESLKSPVGTTDTLNKSDKELPGYLNEAERKILPLLIEGIFPKFEKNVGPIERFAFSAPQDYPKGCCLFFSEKITDSVNIDKNSVNDSVLCKAYLEKSVLSKVKNKLKPGDRVFVCSNKAVVFSEPKPDGNNPYGLRNKFSVINQNGMVKEINMPGGPCSKAKESCQFYVDTKSNDQIEEVDIKIVSPNFTVIGEYKSDGEKFNLFPENPILVGTPQEIINGTLGNLLNSTRYKDNPIINKNDVEEYQKTGGIRSFPSFEIIPDADGNPGLIVIKGKFGFSEINLFLIRQCFNDLINKGSPDCLRKCNTRVLTVDIDPGVNFFGTHPGYKAAYDSDERASYVMAKPFVPENFNTGSQVYKNRMKYAVFTCFAGEKRANDLQFFTELLSVREIGLQKARYLRDLANDYLNKGVIDNPSDGFSPYRLINEDAQCIENTYNLMSSK